jgi:hypothetical protein
MGVLEVMCKSGNLTHRVDSGCENESGNLTPWWTQGLEMFWWLLLLLLLIAY